jgi:hypothetical protein
MSGHSAPRCRRCHHAERFCTCLTQINNRLTEANRHFDAGRQGLGRAEIEQARRILNEMRPYRHTAPMGRRRTVRS